jgi:transposase
MSKGRRRVYTIEFKQQAVDLATRVGFGRAADQLGVHVANIRRWEVENGKQTPVKKAEKVILEEENRRLLKENKELKDVNHILKRAAAFFSQDHLK